jgi:hypothetical protein
MRIKINSTGRASEPAEEARIGGASLLGIPGISQEVLDCVRANVFVADAGLNLVYMNRKATETMRGLGAEVQKAFRVGFGQVLGGSIHRFHQDPARVERILRSPGFQPHDAVVTFGGVTLDTHINQVMGPDGAVAGYVVAWEDISERKAAAERAAALVGRLGETQEVSVALQSVTGATEQMVASIREIARNSAEATATVSEAVAGVESANETMGRLGEASAQINNIVKTITSVAEQTNLLALNATIEAARAGEAGKGFAVVAGEVKDLSRQTREATEEISRMIEGVQTLSRAAIQVITDISGVIGRVSSNQASIASAVEEQTASTNDISANLARAAQRAEGIAAFVAENHAG